MSGIAHSLGYSMARHSKQWLIAVSVLALAIFANYTHQSAKEKERVDAEAALAQTARLQTMEQAKEKAKTDAAALLEKCTTGIPKLVASAGSESKAGNHDIALMVLRPCEGLTLDQPSEDKLKRAITAVKADEARAFSAKAAKDKATKKSQGVSIGATKQDVYDSSWGRPQSVNTTTTAYGTREQWVYGGHNYLYFRNGVLESIQN